VSTFSCLAKIIDHVKSYLQKQLVRRIACCHPVCKAERLVLNNMMHFKNHVARVCKISL
jgi:hypothetical protein